AAHVALLVLVQKEVCVRRIAVACVFEGSLALKEPKAYQGVQPVVNVALAALKAELLADLRTGHWLGRQQREQAKADGCEHHFGCPIARSDLHNLPRVQRSFGQWPLDGCFWQHSVWFLGERY